MRKWLAAVAFLAVLGLYGCGPKQTDEEKNAPPPAGPGHSAPPAETAPGADAPPPPGGAPAAPANEGG